MNDLSLHYLFSNMSTFALLRSARPVRLSQQAIRPTPIARSFQTTSIPRAAAAYGSGPAETTQSSGTADSSASSSQEKKAAKDGQPKPNASSEESAGDKSKPHYKCDPEVKEGGETAKLKKPEDK